MNARITRWLSKVVPETQPPAKTPIAFDHGDTHDTPARPEVWLQPRLCAGLIQITKDTAKPK